MDGFLEANRVVEASLSKLGHVSKSTELPLRKALLVSRTLVKAQTEAESVQHSLLMTHDNSPMSKGSSKLLASMRNSVSYEEDTAVNHLHCRSALKLRPVSPIVNHTSSPSEAKSEKVEDVMEFISHSVISDLLSEDDMDCGAENSSSLPTATTTTTSPPWNSCVESESIGCSRWSPLAPSKDSSPPLSPIKRQHNVAFPPFEGERYNPSDIEETKRFKFSSHDYTESLPGFCDHLSPKNLCSAPLITYMFGKGFGVPSNPMELDWPRSQTREDSLYSMSPSKLFPVLAY